MSQSPARRLPQLAESLTRSLQASDTWRLIFRPDEIHRVPTDDGAAIALGRYLPRVTRRFVEPVMLCHGLGANRFSLDLDERHSLARYLANRGFETWVVELRGRGLAGPAVNATFDAQAMHDVRAAIRAVRSSGADQVTWVGHSKGGLVLYAHLARNPEAPVKAIVAVGSPATFTVQPGLPRFVRTVGPLLELGAIPTQRLVGRLARFGAPPGPVTRYLMRAANVDPDTLRKAMMNMASDVPGGVGRQFAGWIRTGRFDALDGFDYHANLGAVRVPLLLLAGSADLLAPPAAVRFAEKHVGGPVEFHEMGKSTGCQDDYGHGDLIIGRHAPEEVFPLVTRFLERESTPHS